MKFFILSLFILSFTAQSESTSCQSCAAMDNQTKVWSTATTKEKRMQASAASYLALESALKELKPLAPQPELVHSLVQLFGEIYAHDYDPLHDNLSLFRESLEKPEFQKKFQQETRRLPSGQQQKLLAGLKALKARPLSEEGEP